MPLTVDLRDYTIKIRRGDSGSILFKFSKPINDFDIIFSIAKRVDTTSCNDILITKRYSNNEGNLLEVNLTSDETEKLTIGENFIGQYYWSLKLYNRNGFAMTLIPDKFTKTPKIFVYPKIGELINE